MALDVQVYDGFRYEFEEAQLWNSERGEGKRIVILKLIDEARGVESHAYFTPEAFAEFAADAQPNRLLPSTDELRRVGI